MMADPHTNWQSPYESRRGWIIVASMPSPEPKRVPTNEGGRSQARRTGGTMIQERDTCVACGASISTPVCPRCQAEQEPRPVQVDPNDPRTREVGP